MSILLQTSITAKDLKNVRQIFLHGLLVENIDWVFSKVDKETQYMA